MNLVRSNGRDLLAMRLKEFEKEDLAAQQKSEIKRHTDNVVVNFINLADNGFKVVQTRLEKMSPEELIAFNELILQKSRRHLWKDTLSRKIAPVCCFVAGLGGIVSFFASFVVLGPGNSTAEFAFGLIFGSLIVAVAGIAGSVKLCGKSPSFWKTYCDSIRFLKKAKGENYFPVEALSKRLGIAAPKE